MIFRKLNGNAQTLINLRKYNLPSYVFYAAEEYQDYDDPENANGSEEWSQLDAWQSQIETDFDYIYDTLQNVANSKRSMPKTSTPYPQARPPSFGLTSEMTERRLQMTTTPLKAKVKKSVAFDDNEEVQLIEKIEMADNAALGIANGAISNEDAFEEEIEEEEEYSYGGLLRPGSHKPSGYAKSFDHYLNTQDLDKNVQRLKSPSGDDRIRVKKFPKRRSRSPGESKSPSRPTKLKNFEDGDSDYAHAQLPPSYSVPESGNKFGSSSDTGNARRAKCRQLANWGTVKRNKIKLKLKLLMRISATLN